MKFLLKIIFYPLIFLFMLIAFLPKNELYYFALLELKKENIVIAKETTKENFFGFEIDSASTSFNGLPIANIDSTKIQTLLFTNTIEISNIQVEQGFSKFVPSKIDEVIIKYTVLNPLFIIMNAKGKEFSVQGHFDIVSLKFHLDIDASKSFIKNYSMILKYLKQTKEGGYYFEYAL